MSPRWPSVPLLAATLIGVGIAAVVVVLLRAALQEPAGAARFDIRDVISASSLTRHAVVYRFKPADSTATVTGVWIIEGPAPDRDARERPRGQPVAIWRDGTARLGWQGDRLRLIGDRQPVAADGDLTACAERTPKPQLCLDPARVTFVPLPR
jgi:hypothetical protein